MSRAKESPPNQIVIHLSTQDFALVDAERERAIAHTPGARFSRKAWVEQVVRQYLQKLAPAAPVVAQVAAKKRKAS